MENPSPVNGGGFVFCDAWNTVNIHGHNRVNNQKDLFRIP
jgi:hypothetical protein